jgi:hypothetical protein
MAKKPSNKKKIFFFKILSILLIIGFFVLAWWIIWGKFWKINNIEIQGAKHTDISLVKTDVENYLQKKRAFVFPGDNILYFSEKDIKNIILKTYPSVESVIITRTNNRDIIINIVDRKPLGVWCDDDCYFYDDQGIVFKKSFNFTGLIFTRWGQNASSSIGFYDRVPCQKLCTDENFLNFLQKNKIGKIIMDGENLRLYSGYGFYIKALDDPKVIMGDMTVFDKERKGDFSGLEYVDMRFADRIFYK